MLLEETWWKLGGECGSSSLEDVRNVTAGGGRPSQHTWPGPACITLYSPVPPLTRINILFYLSCLYLACVPLVSSLDKRFLPRQSPIVPPPHPSGPNITEVVEMSCSISGGAVRALTEWHCTLTKIQANLL